MITETSEMGTAIVAREHHVIGFLASGLRNLTPGRSVPRQHPGEVLELLHLLSSLFVS
jgi:hypothetical protein